MNERIVSCKSQKVLALALLKLALLMGLVVGCGKTTLTGVSPSTDTIVVNLDVDYGNGELESEAVEIDAPATVLDVLQSAFAGNGLETTGSGETAFVKSINGVANEGKGGKNWTYRVNDKLADRSCGVVEVVDGDRVTWKLGSYTPKDDNE